ncbi:MAG: hypothetical protein Tsb0033_16100 [Winogradskyella sp.]
MVIYILDSKIKDGKLSKHFTYSDIEKCIVESAKIEVGSTPQTEKTVRSLLRFFIEHPPNDELKFTLTDYSKKFIELIHGKLHSPLKYFPLKKTFEKFANFKADEIKSLEDFEMWYSLKFHNASKQTIVDHLEALKDVVKTSINRLNGLLKAESEDLVTITKEFAIVFDEISAKSDEIKYTLRLGNTLSIEIEKVIEFFYGKIESFKHPENEEERFEFKRLNTDYSKAVKIKNDVVDFFNDVDYRLKQLMDRSLYANNQLTNLQDNFRNQSRIRMNLKRLLKFSLEQASYSKNDIIKLPERFPKKALPIERFKFIEVPYYDSFGIKKNEIIPALYDKEHVRKEQDKVQKDLQRQENAARLFREYRALLEEEKELDFTEHFYKILEEENDSEIALSVGFDLFQYANRNPRYEIDIQRELSEVSTTKDILIWKMKIQQVI